MDYGKLIKVGMPFVYEVGAKHKDDMTPRWTYYSFLKGWIDIGYTGIIATAEVLAIHDNVATFVLLEQSFRGIFVIPINDEGENSTIFKPDQWSYPGFLQPDGGWDQYLPINKFVCSCGAEAIARMRNEPVPGHGVLCPKWSRNPYQ